MRKSWRSVLVMILTAALGCGSAIGSQAVVDRISGFGLNYRVIDNKAAANGVDCAKLGADWGLCNRGVITLSNPGPALTDRNWTIWFSSIRQILRVDNDQFRITHVTGDLHKLEPTERFTGFPAGSPVEIPIVNEYWQLFESDVMPRWFVTSSGAKPKLITATATGRQRDFVAPIVGDLWKSPADDKNIFMTPQARFDKNRDVRFLPAGLLRGRILPTPRYVRVFAQDADLGRGVRLDLKGLTPESARVVAARFEQLGVAQRKDGYPILAIADANQFVGRDAVAGAYRLHIGETKAHVVGIDQAGVFNGLQSILSLLPAHGKPVIATLDAVDAPRFAYRGLFIDVARNFHSKASILRAIDQMAAYKLNRLHLHLSDDEGWRIEIPGLPELTAVGGRRALDPTERTALLPQLGSGPDASTTGSGFFSRRDYIEIVRYAATRQIEVIPEIDMPAHARAAVVSMEARHARLMAAGQPKEAERYRLLDPTDRSNITTVQFFDRRSLLNPCLASTRNFVDKVVGEIAKMHKEAGQPLQTWHYGGDEAKNIRLGGGYTDRTNPEAGKGQIDRAAQDKPFAKSEACKQLLALGKLADYEHLPSWFAIEVSRIAKAHGIDRMQAWQDGLKDADNAAAFATGRVGVNFWDTLFWGGASSVNDWANKGYEVVVSNPDYLYLDFPYEVNPQEPGYYWGTRFNDERKIFAFAPDNLPQNAETSVDRDGKWFKARADKPWPGAHGMSAQVWSELVRTDEGMEYRLYPRLLSVAERAWYRAPWEQTYTPGREYEGGKTNFVDTALLERDWTLFANLVGRRELAKLDLAGVAWRLPVPGARVQGRRLEANIALPGLTIEYSTNGGRLWRTYDDSMRPELDGPVMLRSVSPDGRRYSRVEGVMNQEATAGN